LIIEFQIILELFN